MFILDSHCDTPTQILRLRDMSVDNGHAHVDFPKLKKGGVDAAFFALYVPSSYDSDPDAGLAYFEGMLDLLRRSINENASSAAFAFTADQALANKEKGLFSVFTGLENGALIGYHIDRVKYLYDNGIRYVTLCHSSDNQICDSCASENKRWGGLSPFGREVVSEMNRTGMLIDVSHASDETFYDVLECSDRPVIASHSCCRALSEHPRNMSDDMIRSLADAGGLIQINFYPLFLDVRYREIFDGNDMMERGEIIENKFISDPSDIVSRTEWYKFLDELQELRRPSYKSVVDHIDHVVSLVGADHVGIGSDFDGIALTPEGLENASMTYRIFDEMHDRGYSDSEIEKVAGLNMLRLL